MKGFFIQHPHLREIVKVVTPDYYDLIGLIGLGVILKDISIVLGLILMILSIYEKILKIITQKKIDKINKEENNAKKHQ